MVRRFEEKTPGQRKREINDLTKHNQLLSKQLNTAKEFIRNNPIVLNEFNKEFSQNNEQDKEQASEPNHKREKSNDMERD